MKKPGPQTEFNIIDRHQRYEREEVERTPSLSAELDRLFETHRAKVYTLCIRRVKDATWAEELTQDTLMVAYRRLPDFEQRARFSSWIFSIANNVCLRALQKKREYLSDDGVLEPTDEVFDVLTTLEFAERDQLLEEVMVAVLDPQEREAVRLRYIQYLSQDDITAVLGLEGSGARGLLQRCRRKLRAELLRRLEALGHGPSLLLPKGPR